jgi:hypothetical protein
VAIRLSWPPMRRLSKSANTAGQSKNRFPVRSVSIPFGPYQCNTVNSKRHPFSLNGQQWWPFVALGMDSIDMPAAPFQVSSYVS